MKFIKQLLSNAQQILCNLFGCNYPIPIKYGKPLRNNNSFSRHYHINDFTNLDFPQRQIYKFFDLAEDQIILTLNDEDEVVEEYNAILLTVIVKSCNKNSLSNSFHENSFAESFNSYNKQLIITNIPADLKDQKKLRIDLLFNRLYQRVYK